MIERSALAFIKWQANRILSISCDLTEFDVLTKYSVSILTLLKILVLKHAFALRRGITLIKSLNTNNFKETGVCILNDTFNAYHLKSNKDSMYPFIGNHDITKKTKYIKNF